MSKSFPACEPASLFRKTDKAETRDRYTNPRMPQVVCLEGHHSFKLGSVSTSQSRTICSSGEPCANLYLNYNSKRARDDLGQRDLVQRETKRRRTKVVKTRSAQVNPAHLRRPRQIVPKTLWCTELMIKDTVQFLLCDELLPPSFSSDCTDGNGDWSSALMDFDCLAVEFEPERCIKHHSEPLSPPRTADIFDISHIPVTVSAHMQHCTNPLIAGCGYGFFAFACYSTSLLICSVLRSYLKSNVCRSS